MHSRTNYPPIWVQGPVDVGSLTIRNYSRDERNIDVPSIRVEAAAKVKRLTVRDCQVVNRLDRPLAFFDLQGRIERLTEENNMFTDAPGKNIAE